LIDEVVFVIKKWNRSFTVIGVLIGLLALLSACVRTSAEISNENYSLYQSEDAWHLENRAEVQAVEIRLGNEYDSERIRVCEGFLSLIKSVEGGTLIALVPETGTIQADTVLLSVHTQKAPELIDYVTVSSQAYAKTVEKTNSTRAYPAGISIIDNLVEPGSEADILVHAKDVNGLTGFDLFLTYDPQVIEPDPFAHDFVELTGALNDYHFQILKAELMEPGKIWISAGTTEMVVDFPDDHIIRVNMREGIGGFQPNFNSFQFFVYR